MLKKQNRDDAAFISHISKIRNVKRINFNDYQYREGMRRLHFMALQIEVKQEEADLMKTHDTAFGKYFSFLSSL